MDLIETKKILET